MNIDPKISKNFRQVDRTGIEAVSQLLKHHYFSQSYLDERNSSNLGAFMSSQAGKSDFYNHLHRRLDTFRKTIIPWLNDAKPLSGSTILEIGCGTGSSTVALAEQGSTVYAIDLEEGSLEVAKGRCRTYGLNTYFAKANAVDIGRLFANQHFDFIIFFAALEHMTTDERIASMQMAWNMLSENCFWCVIETPNRLWFQDDHTSLLPFYSWLPDDLAFLYSQHSPRESFSKSYRELNEKDLLSFLRRGRGVSYHEFDLALGNSVDLDVTSSLALYIRTQEPERASQWVHSIGHQYESLLTAMGPKIHPGFYQPQLDLIIRKQ